MENRDEVNEKVSERDYEVEMLGSDGTGGGVNVVCVICSLVIEGG